MARHERKDYYSTLGVQRDSSPEEIKRAYRALAFQYHPDRNPEAREWAEEKFKSITEAYGVLMDAGKRQAYDRMKRHGSSRRDGQESGFGYSSQDIFRDLFGNEFASRVFQDLERDFTKHGMRFDRAFFENIFSGGRGIFFGGVFFFGPMGRPQTRQRGARGRNRVDMNKVMFEALKQTRARPEPFLARVGRTLGRLAEKALPKGREQPKADPDLHYALSISPDEAAAGTEISISLSRGRDQEKLLVKIPAGTVSGTTLRLKGKGRVVRGREPSPGHLYIRVHVSAASGGADMEGQGAKF